MLETSRPPSYPPISPIPYPSPPPVFCLVRFLIPSFAFMASLVVFVLPFLFVSLSLFSSHSLHKLLLLPSSSIFYSRFQFLILPLTLRTPFSNTFYSLPRHLLPPPTLLNPCLPLRFFSTPTLSSFPLFFFLLFSHPLLTNPCFLLHSSFPSLYSLPSRIFLTSPSFPSPFPSSYFFPSSSSLFLPPPLPPAPSHRFFLLPLPPLLCITLSPLFLHPSSSPAFSFPFPKYSFNSLLPACTSPFTTFFPLVLPFYPISPTPLPPFPSFHFTSSPSSIYPSTSSLLLLFSHFKSVNQFSCFILLHFIYSYVTIYLCFSHLHVLYN